MKRSLSVLALALLLLAVGLVLRAAWLPSRQIRVEPAAAIALDEAAVAAGLAESLRFPTLSEQQGERLDAAAFRSLQRWLERRFPRMHAALARERVAEHSLLYTWRGRSDALPPLLLLAHQDVVPVPGASRWTHPPFAGEIAGGYVWGRGALDDKGSLVALCEAVETLLARGFAPERSVLLAFGHDEEIGGAGAAAMAERLEARGLRAALVLDEGQMLLRDVLPGLERPLALVGVAEKGYATLSLRVEALGGHSSIPPPRTAVGILAGALHRLESSPMPSEIRGATRALFEHLAPELPWPQRVVLANSALFSPLLRRLLGRNPGLDAMLRSTTAATMLHGSEKENVLPSLATAAVNFRILPGQSSEDVLRHAREVVADPRVELDFLAPPSEPSAVAPTEAPAYRLLQRVIAGSFPGAVVAPSLTVGATDARHYRRISEAIYRFAPFVLGPEDLGRIHGIDERIAISDYAEGIRFYMRLLRAAAGSEDGLG